MHWLAGAQVSNGIVTVYGFLIYDSKLDWLETFGNCVFSSQCLISSWHVVIESLNHYCKCREVSLIGEVNCMAWDNVAFRQGEWSGTKNK